MLGEHFRKNGLPLRLLCFACVCVLIQVESRAWPIEVEGEVLLQQ